MSNVSALTAALAMAVLLTLEAQQPTRTLVAGFAGSWLSDVPSWTVTGNGNRNNVPSLSLASAPCFLTISQEDSVLTVIEHYVFGTNTVAYPLDDRTITNPVLVSAPKEPWKKVPGVFTARVNGGELRSLFTFMMPGEETARRYERTMSLVEDNVLTVEERWTGTPHGRKGLYRRAEVKAPGCGNR